MSASIQHSWQNWRTLVLGGARSGKSAHAEGLLPADEPACYVATARHDPADAEWTERIAAHVARRPTTWRTVEAADPALLPELIAGHRAGEPALLVDDLVTWLTTVLDDAGAWERDPAALRQVATQCDALVTAVGQCAGRLVLVSAEVGLGVVPATRSGRLFRDELGALNARLAESCDEVVLLVAGVPLQLRSRGSAPVATTHARPRRNGLSTESEAMSPEIQFGEVPAPDERAHEQAAARQDQLTKPAGSLGSLEQLGVWVAARQGQCPPRPFERPRVVIFAGDHGVTSSGVSAYPSEVTGQMVANFLAGGAAANVLAAAAGATVRVLDISVDSDTPESVRTHKVRRGSGSIDREDALTQAEVTAAIKAGIRAADEEIDSGADLLIAGDMGIGNTTPSAVLTAAITGAEPVAVVGRGTGIDDQAWMRKTAAIRDALRRARKVVEDPVALLRTAGGADIAALAGFLAQAAVRRTPVLLDGVVVGAAALVAQELAPGARQWWLAGHRSAEPSASLVLEHLDLVPVLDLGMRLGEGSGALTALPVVTAAVRVLGEMVTFAEAGVAGPSESEENSAAAAQ